MNNLIETIRLEMYRQRLQIQEFAEKVGVSINTIKNIFGGDAPRYKAFLKMLEVLNIQIQFKTELDILGAWEKSLEEAKRKEQVILFMWRNLARIRFAGLADRDIVAELMLNLSKKRHYINGYWHATIYPRLDSLIALFAAVNVEIVLATKQDKLPTLLDKPKNLN